MLWFLLTVMDLLVAVSLVLAQVGLLDSFRILLTSAIYLAAKGYVFKGDLLSILDMLSAAYIVLMMFGVKTFLAYFVVAYLLYKVVVYFLMLRMG